ncbi:MAG: DUF1707 SHOCT-like domain-containing protein [Streptosporangiaceae bacterium]
MPADFPSPGDRSGHAPPHEMRASDADRDRVMDVLRNATAEGRLTADELEERLGAALTARTFGDLAALTEDLPVGPDLLPQPDLQPQPDLLTQPATEQADEVHRIDQRGGAFQRAGRWVVPQRLELRSSWCDVLLDFTEAVITNDTLLIDLRMRGGSLILVTGPGMLVDVDALYVRYTDVKIDPAPRSAGPIVLRVRLIGRMRYGWVETRWQRQAPA